MAAAVGRRVVLIRSEYPLFAARRSLLPFRHSSVISLRLIHSRRTLPATSLTTPFARSCRVRPVPRSFRGSHGRVSEQTGGGKTKEDLLRVSHHQACARRLFARKRRGEVSVLDRGASAVFEGRGVQGVTFATNWKVTEQTDASQRLQKTRTGTTAQLAPNERT